MSDFAMGKLMAELLSIGVPTEVRRKNWREDPNGAPPMRMLLVRSF
jgi:1,6-anhydro-N-acetylmuramate kinase